MHSLKILLCTGFLLLTSSWSFGQHLEELKEILASSQSYFDAQDQYAIGLTYSFYDLEKSDEPLQQMQGVSKKQHKDQYSRIDKTEFALIDGLFIKVNHKERAVVVLEGVNEQLKTPLEISKMTDFFKDAQVLEADGLIQCEVQFKQVPGLPYSRMSLLLDATDKKILKQEIHLLPNQGQWAGYPTAEAVQKGMIALDFDYSPAIAQAQKDIHLGDFIKQRSPLILADRLAAYSMH
ncbi:hypothetical protein [Gilvibacter sp.]|uniref:hypothetical protein n=1 Tax=Gilvibacter sp. TaxID=2729997 RepID=UPI003F4A3CD9